MLMRRTSWSLFSSSIAAAQALIRRVVGGPHTHAAYLVVGVPPSHFGEEELAEAAQRATLIRIFVFPLRIYLLHVLISPIYNPSS